MPVLNSVDPEYVTASPSGSVALTVPVTQPVDRSVFVTAAPWVNDGLWLTVTVIGTVTDAVPP